MRQRLLILCICENEQDGVKVWDIDVIDGIPFRKWRNN